VIKKGAVVEYAIVGEGTVIEEKAHVGTAPDGSEGWGVATCGPDLKIRPGAQVPANAMIYTSEEV
jgi:glucose-1-phosphate adenylyltransferase